jgi:hypothetical protein
MDRTRSTRVERRNAYRVLMKKKTGRKRDREDVDVGVKIILK